MVMTGQLQKVSRKKDPMSSARAQLSHMTTHSGNNPPGRFTSSFMAALPEALQ